MKEFRHKKYLRPLSHLNKVFWFWGGLQFMKVARWGRQRLIKIFNTSAALGMVEGSAWALGVEKGKIWGGKNESYNKKVTRNLHGLILATLQIIRSFPQFPPRIYTSTWFPNLNLYLLPKVVWKFARVRFESNFLTQNKQLYSAANVIYVYRRFRIPD